MLHQEHFRFSHHSKERPCASVDLAACQHARTTVTMSVSRDRNSVVLNRAIMQQVETWWAEVYENRVNLEYPLFVQATVPLRLIGVDTTIANSSLSENEFFFLEEFTETYKVKLEGDFNTVVGSNIEGAKNDIARQLATIMNIDVSRIQNLELSPGKTIVIQYFLYVFLPNSAQIRL